MKTLHIAAHYGGGVGTVVYSWVNSCKYHTHTLAYLNDIPENKKPGQVLFDVNMISQHDIVIVHVWNHPALFDFLVNTPLPPCRLIGWSHMAGHNPPYILFDKLIDYFDDFYFTSPVCCDRATEEKTVWSSGDMTRFLKIEPCQNEVFTIGYIGTLDFSKIHRDFIKICAAIDIPEARFIVVGSGSDAGIIQKQAGAAGLSMFFTGQVKDTAPLLRHIDVFLYPLSELHYGTCEQILGETLCAGIPAICLDNPAENIIIKNSENGFLCRDKFEIAEKIKNIYEKKIIFDSKKIKSLAKNLYNIENKVNRWNEICNRSLSISKSGRAWKNESGNEFIESLGPAGLIFQSGDREKIENLYRKNYYQWRSKNKGSINQYANYFKSNKKIQEWREILWDVQRVMENQESCSGLLLRQKLTE
jgi:L-malate glycosyltransferase